MTSAREIVSRFGGQTKLSERLGNRRDPTVAGVGMWLVRGVIPFKWHDDLLDLAETEGIPLTRDELLSTTRRSGGTSPPSKGPSRHPVRSGA